MSLSRAAARIAARYALLGETLAEGRVFDSAISPLDVTVAEQQKPLLIVMTDDDEATVDGRDIMNGERECELILVIAVTGTTSMSEGGVTLSLLPSDEGLDLALDILEHQALSILQGGNAPWARAFRAMTPRIMAASSKRGGGDDGIKFAARQIVLSCDLIGVPVSGAPISEGSAWDEFLTAAEAEADTSSTAALMRSIIEGDVLDDWERARRALGLSDDTKIGMGPLFVSDSDEHALDRLDVRTGDVPGSGTYTIETEG